MKRIMLFLATNIAVLVVLSIIVNVFGLGRYLTEEGIDYNALLVFSAVIGFGGSFISLLISKWMAKTSTGARVIDGSEGTTEYWLVQTVQKLAQQAGIGMPEVAVYEGAPNAFATGAFKNSALVAVSTGLLQSMSREEVEAVLGHEVAHVANGDMVTMTLIQGVVNAFVMFLAMLFHMQLHRAYRSFAFFARVDRPDRRVIGERLAFAGRLPLLLRQPDVHDHRTVAGANLERVLEPAAIEPLSFNLSVRDARSKLSARTRAIAASSASRRST